MLDSYAAHGRVRPVEGGKIGVTFGETELCLTPAEWAPLASRILAACGASAGDAPNWTIDPEAFTPASDEVIAAVFAKRKDVERCLPSDKGNVRAPDAVPLPTAAELAEMRARVDAASSAPWYVDSDMLMCSDTFGPDDEWVPEEDFGEDKAVSDGRYWHTPKNVENMAFAAHARSDMPRLISAVEALTSEREDLRTALVGVVNATDGCASHSASTEFLCHAPGEVAAIKQQRDDARSAIARLDAEIRELRMQAIADFGQIQNATPALEMAAPADDAPLNVALERLREVIGPNGRANVTAYLAEREAEYWDGGDWYGAYRRRVEEERAATFDAGKEGGK